MIYIRAKPYHLCNCWRTLLIDNHTVRTYDVRQLERQWITQFFTIFFSLFLSTPTTVGRLLLPSFTEFGLAWFHLTATAAAGGFDVRSSTRLIRLWNFSSLVCLSVSIGFQNNQHQHWSGRCCFCCCWWWRKDCSTAIQFSVILLSNPTARWRIFAERTRPDRRLSQKVNEIWDEKKHPIHSVWTSLVFIESEKRLTNRVAQNRTTTFDTHAEHTQNTN